VSYPNCFFPAPMGGRCTYFTALPSNHPALYLYLYLVLHQTVHREYCETESFTASCSASQVIIVRHALYGRMRLGRCVIRDYGYVGCYVDVLGHMDAMCSGTSQCHVRIPDPTLDRVNKCPKDFKTYLEISYDCVPGTISCITLNSLPRTV